MKAVPRARSTRPSARQRILDTAYGLLAQRGVRDVGVDELIARSGVAKATFYRHFHTKDALVRAYLDRWYAIRSEAIAAALAELDPADDPTQIFTHVLDQWFEHGAEEVGAFLHIMIEMGPTHPLGQAAMAHLAGVRQQISELAERLGLAQPGEFAWSFHLLTKGAIITALEGDDKALERVRELLGNLIDVHRRRDPNSTLPAQRSARRRTTGSSTSIV